MHKKEVSLLIRPARAMDAALLVAFLNQVGTESDFMTLDDQGIDLTVEEMKEVTKRYASLDNHLYLVAFLDGELVGLLSIAAEMSQRICHIGEVFIVVAKKYHNQGIGRLLLEDGLDWAENYSQSIYRLQLSVQKRNEAALHLYTSMGFQIEGIQERGAFVNGEFVTVYLMGKLIG